MKVFIREIDPDSLQEIKLVAERMRKTLIDVLGEDQGKAMYTLDWLENRVRWHLELRNNAKIYLAENANKNIIGQAIVRAEKDENGRDYGYFSTIYVAPEFRDQGVATNLIHQVENWCQASGFYKIIYNTAEDNHKLIRLYEKFGFSITLRESKMVQLTKSAMNITIIDEHLEGNK